MSHDVIYHHFFLVLNFRLIEKLGLKSLRKIVEILTLLSTTAVIGKNDIKEEVFDGFLRGLF